jgi:hypothetical protein
MYQFCMVRDVTLPCEGPIPGQIWGVKRGSLPLGRRNFGITGCEVTFAHRADFFYYHLTASNLGNQAKDCHIR